MQWLERIIDSILVQMKFIYWPHAAQNYFTNCYSFLEILSNGEQIMILMENHKQLLRNQFSFGCDIRKLCANYEISHTKKFEAINWKIESRNPIAKHLMSFISFGLIFFREKIGIISWRKLNYTLWYFWPFKNVSMAVQFSMIY